MLTGAAGELRRGGVIRLVEPWPCCDGATVARRAGGDGNADADWPVAVGSAADLDGVGEDAVVVALAAVASVGAAPEPFGGTVTVAAVLAAAATDGIGMVAVSGGGWDVGVSVGVSVGVGLGVGGMVGAAVGIGVRVLVLVGTRVAEGDGVTVAVAVAVGDAVAVGSMLIAGSVVAVGLDDGDGMVAVGEGEGMPAGLEAPVAVGLAVEAGGDADGTDRNVALGDDVRVGPGVTTVTTPVTPSVPASI